MIRLDVQPYCHYCPDFTADVEPPSKIYGADGEFCDHTDTIVRCKYRNRCSAVCRYLEKYRKGENDG